MKDKDYHSIYVKCFNENIEKYISKIESVYKSSLEEGDAHNFVYQSCLTFLPEKRIKETIYSHPYSELYSIFKNRSELVQESNPNRLYLKHFIPACEKMKIELNEGVLENFIKKIAIYEASVTIRSWYSNWSRVYEMMFELKDFTEFKIIRNAAFSEGGEIFKKYQKRSYPSSFSYQEKVNKKINQQGVEIKQVRSFKIKDHFKLELGLLYNDLTLHFINGKKTSEEDFIQVFGQNWEDDSNSIVQFKCTTQLAAYMLRKLEVLFDELTFTNVLASKKIKSKHGNIFKDKNLSKSLGEFEKKISEDIISDKENSIKKDLDALIENFIK